MLIRICNAAASLLRPTRSRLASGESVLMDRCCPGLVSPISGVTARSAGQTPEAAQLRARREVRQRYQLPAMQLTGAGVAGGGLLPHRVVDGVLEASILRKHVALVGCARQGVEGLYQGSVHATMQSPPFTPPCNLHRGILPRAVRSPAPPSAFLSTSCGLPISLISSLVLLFPGLLKPLQPAPAPRGLMCGPLCSEARSALTVPHWTGSCSKAEGPAWRAWALEGRGAWLFSTAQVGSSPSAPEAELWPIGLRGGQLHINF